jgi:hypothetical protein
MSDGGPKTPIQCRACGGYADGCKWCRDPITGLSNGTMTAEQLADWTEHKSGSRPAFNPATAVGHPISPTPMPGTLTPEDTQPIGVPPKEPLTKPGRRPSSGTMNRADFSKADTQPIMRHRALILERLAVVWDKAPAMRLGELIVKTLIFADAPPGTLEQLDDRRLCELIEAYVLLGTPR